jgi:hypothetical protein
VIFNFGVILKCEFKKQSKNKKAQARREFEKLAWVSTIQ